MFLYQEDESAILYSLWFVVYVKVILLDIMHLK